MLSTLRRSSRRGARATLEATVEVELTISQKMSAIRNSKKRHHGIIAQQAQLKAAGYKLGGGRETAALAESMAGTLTGSVRRARGVESGAMEWQPVAAAHTTVLKCKDAAQATHRPVKRARAVVSSCTSRVQPMALATAEAELGALTLEVDTSSRKNKLYKTTAEKLLDTHIQKLTVVEAPVDEEQGERTAVGVRLLGEGLSDEQSTFWVEYLSSKDLGQEDGAWFGAASASAYNDVFQLEKPFHTRGVRDALEAKDYKFVDDAKTIEIGYSTMSGGSKVQMEAHRNGHAFNLKNNKLAKDLCAPCSPPTPSQPHVQPI